MSLSVITLRIDIVIINPMHFINDFFKVNHTIAEKCINMHVSNTDSLSEYYHFICIFRNNIKKEKFLKKKPNSFSIFQARSLVFEREWDQTQQKKIDRSNRNQKTKTKNQIPKIMKMPM